MRRVIVAAVLAGAVIAVVAAGPLMSRVEQPDYQVERTEEPIEVRAYPSMTVATTIVNGSRAHAANRGFRVLANYIFGENEGSKKIAMTAPVMQARASDASSHSIGEGGWRVRFVMPHEWSKESLPPPRDRHVKLETVPSGRFAVIRFSGFWRDALLQRKTDELEAYIARNQLSAVGEAIYAFYNPPWTLPFFRRNEVLIEVRPR